MYDNCLRDDSSDSKRGQLEAITPAKPSWLNDYYVATALKSLLDEGKVVKPESTEGGRRVSVLKRQEGAPVLLG